MRQLALILVLLLTVPLHGSLTFTNNNSDRVNVGQAASLDDMQGTTSPTGNFTACMWININTTADKIIFQKGTFGGSSAQSFILEFSTGNFHYIYVRSTSLEMEAPKANFSALATSTWVFLCAVANAGGANGDQDLWLGNLTTAPAEPSSYTSQVVGSGDHTTNGSDDMIIGNDVNQTQAIPGQIAMIGFWKRAFSSTEMDALRRIWNCNYPVASQGCWVFGVGNSTGTQPDWSGNGNNGTVTGATATDMPAVSYFVPGVLSITADVGVAAKRLWRALWQRLTPWEGYVG